MSWTDQRITRLKELWPDNSMSAEAIASILNREFPGDGLSRSAVIGKAMRLQLPLRRSAPQLASNGSNGAHKQNGAKILFDFRAKPKLNGAAPSSAKPIDLPKFPFRESDPASSPLPFDDDDTCHARGAESGGLLPQSSPIDFAAVVGAAKSSRCTIFDLTMDTCRWPMGDPQTPEFFFCGQTPKAGRPYCSLHCRMAYHRR